VFGCNSEDYVRANTYGPVESTLSNVSILSCFLFPGIALALFSLGQLCRFNAVECLSAIHHETTSVDDFLPITQIMYVNLGKITVACPIIPVVEGIVRRPAVPLFVNALWSNFSLSPPHGHCKRNHQVPAPCFLTSCRVVDGKRTKTEHAEGRRRKSDIQAGPQKRLALHDVQRGCEQ
jgi:hypothetical protein